MGILTNNKTYAVNRAGTWMLTYSATFTGTKGDLYGFAIAKNGIKQNNTYSRSQLQGVITAGEQSAGGMGFVNLNKYDNITLIAGNELDVNSITIVTANLVATRISQI